jgi:hypothetical protein
LEKPTLSQAETVNHHARSDLQQRRGESWLEKMENRENRSTKKGKKKKKREERERNRENEREGKKKKTSFVKSYCSILAI